MEQVWYTIEGNSHGAWNAVDDAWVMGDDATEYDEYNDAALVAKGLGNCVVIRHNKKVGGVEHTRVVGEF